MLSMHTVCAQIILLVLLGLLRNGGASADAGGVDGWAPFRATALSGAYVSVIRRSTGLELWQDADPEGVEPRRSLVVRRGTRLDSLSERVVVLNAAIIDDVFDPSDSTRLDGERHFSRAWVDFVEGVGYLQLAGVTGVYRPGRAPLLPALFASADGAPGSWRYLGKLRGEPADYAAQHYVWSDGGAIVRLADGRWRIYTNGYGARFAALEADTLDGSWRFLRDQVGAIRELASSLKTTDGALPSLAFPTVLRITEGEWHAWLSEGWPVTAIWHLSSPDGLHWQPYRRQPEIRTATVGDKAIKCLRVYHDAADQRLVGLLSVWDSLPQGGEGWRLYQSWMAAGPP